MNLADTNNRKVQVDAIYYPVYRLQSVKLMFLNSKWQRLVKIRPVTIGSTTKAEPWQCVMESQHSEVPSPGVTAVSGFADQGKPVRFESA